MRWGISLTIIFIIFWDFLIFYQISLSPQVKRCVIITYKHGIYELPHELPNDLRLRILKNCKIWGKRLIFVEWYPSVQSSFQNENFLYPSKNFLKKKLKFFRKALLQMKIRVSLKYFVFDCFWKPVFDFISPQTRWNVFCFW